MSRITDDILGISMVVLNVVLNVVDSTLNVGLDNFRGITATNATLIISTLNPIEMVFVKFCS